MTLTPETRSLINSANAYECWVNCPYRTAATAPAREGFDRRFERLVDPEGKLPPEERARRAETARRAHFKRMAANSALACVRAKAVRETAAQEGGA